MDGQQQNAGEQSDAGRRRNDGRGKRKGTFDRGTYMQLDRGGWDAVRAAQRQDDEQVRVDAEAPMSPGMQANAEAPMSTGMPQQPEEQQLQPEEQREKQPQQPEEQSEAGQMPGSMDGNQQIVNVTMLGKWSEEYHLRITVQAQNDTDTLSDAVQAAKEVLRKYGIPGSLMKRTYFSAPTEAEEWGEVDTINPIPVHEIDVKQATIKSALQWNDSKGLQSSEVWIAFAGRRGAGGAAGAAGAVDAADAARVAGAPAKVLKVEVLGESEFSATTLEFCRNYELLREARGASVYPHVGVPRPTPKGV
jgi:hypothetical protein